MNRVELGWAVLLSVPVGIGVWLAVLRTSGGRSDVLAVAAGLAAATAVFLVVVAGVVDWSGRSGAE